MKDFVIESPFRLSTGGLFYHLLLRCGLVEENRYVPWRRIALFTGLTWLPLLVMTAIDGALLVFFALNRSFGVAMTPGLVIDGEVKSVGKIPKASKIAVPGTRRPSTR